MTAILVYRDKLVPKSEIGFLRRQYSAFSRLEPHWIGCSTSADVGELTPSPIVLGRAGPFGALDRALFKQCARVPEAPSLRPLGARLIHAQFGRGGALALPLAAALRIPLVVTFHGGDAHKNKHYEKRLLPTIYQRRLEALKAQASLFICVSESVREKLVERGFPTAKLAVINIGIDLDPAMEPPKEPPYVFFAGRFVEKKGIPVLIDAVRLLRQRGVGVGVVLAGDGPMLAEMKSRASGLDGVEFLGWQSQAATRHRMRGASLVVVPSITAAGGDAEGLPTVAMEAMSAAVPVVATDAAGLGGVVENGRNALIVPAGDAAALADAMQSIADDPVRRAALGAAGRALAEERLSAAVQSRRLEDRLIDVIGAFQES